MATRATGRPRGWAISSHSPCSSLCALLLILDLGVPVRFWHMLVQSHRIPYPVFKPWSPISLGVWILTTFGLLSFVAFVGTLVETGRVRWPPLLRVARGCGAWRARS